MSENAKIQASVLHGAKDLHLESVSLPPPAPTELQVAVRSTTLCGSDLHYYNHYRNGDIIVKQPLALGHESSGVVTAVGSSCDGWSVGDRVALEVGLPCDTCDRCSEGRYNLCPSMRFRSSAKADPHFWGTLQEKINHPAKWCHKLPASISYTQASLLEPLGVALHSTARTQKNGTLFEGANVLVIGAGAVGLLVAAAAQMAGAGKICITDINARRLEFAASQGWVTHTYLTPMGPRPETVDEKLAAAKDASAKMLAKMGVEGGVDVVYECTGMEPCVQSGIYATRPGGTLLLVGMGNPIMTLPISAAALREVDILGGFRYAGTYPRGIEMLESGKLKKVEKLVTHAFDGIDNVSGAFEQAGKQEDKDGKLVIKVEIRFGSDE